MDQLQSIARKAREREGLILTKAVTEVRGMSRRDVRRAKRRQDTYSFLKALTISVETICVLVVCFLGILTYFEVTIDSESSFYASQLTIELALLLLILAVIAFENVGLRLLLLLAVVVALFINVFEVGYFLLYNRHSPECRNIYMFGIKVCISTQPPFTHHSTVAASFLALFHVILIVLATGLLASHPGTLCDLVERTNPQVVRRYLRQRSRSARLQRQQMRALRSQRSERQQIASQREQPSVSRSERSSRSASRRSRRSGTRSVTTVQKKTVSRSPATLDITKLPDGTRFKTTNNKSFHMEYYVENGVFVGSGTETTNKAISICAPIRPSADPSAISRRRRNLSDGDSDSRGHLDIDNKNTLTRQETRNV